MAWARLVERKDRAARRANHVVTTQAPLTRLRPVTTGPDVDLSAAERAAHDLLTSTPFAPTTVPNAAGYDELVVATGIPFHSLCEHHLLPFAGVAHVGYLPGGRIVSPSKLARLVELVARSLQVQERLTTQVAQWLDEHLAPKGVGVVIDGGSRV
jgi:hypothetical protein